MEGKKKNKPSSSSDGQQRQSDRPPSVRLSQMSLSGSDQQASQGRPQGSQDEQKYQSKESLPSTSQVSWRQNPPRSQQQQQQQELPRSVPQWRQRPQQQQQRQATKSDQQQQSAWRPQQTRQQPQGAWSKKPQQQTAWRSHEKQPPKNEPIQYPQQRKQEPPKSQQLREPIASGSKQPDAPPKNVQQQLKLESSMPLLTCVYKGSGKNGEHVGKIETNYLKLDISNLKTVVYHYDVTIDPDRPKKLLPCVFSTFRANNFRDEQIAFDGRKNAYAPRTLDLSCVNSEVDVIDQMTGRSRKYKVTIQKAEDSAIPLDWLRDYSKIRLSDIPQRGLQFLDIMMKGAFQRLTGVQAGRSFFLPQDNRVYLGDYFELWTGLFQSVRLGAVPYLNVDVAHKAFPKRYNNMVDLVRDVCKDVCYKFRIDLTDYSRMDRRAIGAVNAALTNHLKGMDICYTKPGNADLPRVFKFKGVDDIPARCKFTHDGKTISVLEYFKDHVQYPMMPCVNLGERATVPIEFCSLLDAQAVNRKTTAKQTSEMIKVAATSTEVRKQKIMQLLDTIDHNEAPILNEFGLRVGGEFAKVSARILQPPNIIYASNVVTPKLGKWSGERVKFLEPEAPTIWGVLNMDRGTAPDMINRFCEKIFELSRAANMQLAPIDSSLNCRFNFDSKQSIEENLDKQLMDMKRKKVSILFVIISHDDMYAQVKQRAEIECGVLTQCVKAFTIKKKGTDNNTVFNILLKVNAKLNGINHRLQTDQIKHESLVNLQNDENHKNLMKITRCMVIGADVTHPSPGEQTIPSVVGVAASYDEYAFAYKFHWRLQEPGREIIQDFENIIKEQLRFYKEKNAHWPTKLIYYRDGVSEGQFQQVMAVEKQAISNACRSLADEPVKLTIIVVQKRHHTRFFPGEFGIGKGDRNFNVPAGTIVDTEITHPKENHFFLASHQSIQGVTKPTKYCILFDESQFSIDDIQGFSFNLCHLFARCNRSVSYPAPTYYAHLVAERGRVYIKGKRINFQNLQGQWRSLEVKPEIINEHPMYFV